MSGATQTNPKNSPLMQALAACIAACEYCAAACLAEEDVPMMRDCIRTDHDCADMCRLTSAFIARNSAFASAMARECINVIRTCEQECAKHQHDHCQECADACRNALRALESYTD